MRYISEAMESNWPSESVLQSFYEHVIKGKSYEDKFSRYFTNTHIVNSTSDVTETDNLNLHQKTERGKVIRSNFSKVIMYYAEWTYKAYKDTPKYTLQSMVGNVGGALNLWAGITVVVAVEVLELILRMLFYDWSMKGQKGKVEVLPKKVKPGFTTVQAFE